MVVETAYRVELIRDVMIPMRDGVRLAGNLFLPEEPGRYPGILSFTPYVKDGYGGQAHEPHHRHFASRGYAVMQVDFRGTGASEGTNPHPFDVQEREDGYDIVEWMAAQPWCTGSVGVWGISYGGITSLSIASTQPPHLRAIIPIHATYDNYEWLHRTHGSRGLLLGDVDWGTRMAASNLLPPVRQDSEGRWARLWAERLEANTPWFFDWHGDPPDPDFWARRRIPCERITVPTFGICGWFDAYTAPTFTVFEAVRAPKRVLIGPWKHALPDLSPVDPIGGAHEMVRWWDRWLKGIENGVDEDPPVTIYVMGANEWRHETEWPIARTRSLRLFPQENRGLAEQGPDSTEGDSYTYDARVGTGSIGYNGHRLNLPIPSDQSFDDHRSLTYTGEPLAEDLEITGTPFAHVTLSATTDEVTLVAKLCVVNRDGASRVISQGNANPAREGAHAAPQPLVAGERRFVRFPMHPTSTMVRAGEQLRLCLAGADFPDLWPTPRPYTMEIHRGQDATWIDVPVVCPRPEPLPAPKLEPARTDLFAPDSSGGVDSHVVHQHLGSRIVGFETRRNWQFPIDPETRLLSDHHATVTTDADRPWTTNLRADSRFELRRPLGTISVRVQSLLTPFAVHADAEIDLDGQPYFRRSWHKTIDDWTSESPEAREG